MKLAAKNFYFGCSFRYALDTALNTNLDTDLDDILQFKGSSNNLVGTSYELTLYE